MTDAIAPIAGAAATVIPDVALDVASAPLNGIADQAEGVPPPSAAEGE